LWSTHHPATKVACRPALRNERCSTRWGAVATSATGNPPSVDSTAALTLSTPSDMRQNVRTASTESSQHPTCFALDPPFTPVKGEAAAAPGTSCVYACRGCHTALFRSTDLVPGSRVGQHTSGWPTFVAPLTTSTLRLHTVLQKSVVASLSDALSALPSRTSVAGTSKPLQVRVPDAGMVPRGLAVEGDVVRLRGRHISAQHTQSWREACLRDENHRADPTLVVGCCGRCGSPVCQVTHSAAEGSRYVVTASHVVAREPGNE
jgi:hypothetical protein